MARALGRHLQQSQTPGMQGSYEKKVSAQQIGEEALKVTRKDRKLLSQMTSKS